MSTLRAASVFGVAALIVGCAHPPPIDRDYLTGRLAVRVEGRADRSLSAAFELSGNAAQGRLILSGPLGTTAAQATWTADQAWLVTNDGRTDFADLESLAAAALGERIPIAALFAWLRGQAWSGATSVARSDGVAGFDQLGWRVDLSRWSDGWLEARRELAPAVTVRARLEPS